MATILVVFPSSGDPIVIRYETNVRCGEIIYWSVFSLNTAVQRVSIQFQSGVNYFLDGSGILTNSTDEPLDPQPYDSTKYTGMGQGCVRGVSPRYSAKTTDKYSVIGLT